MKREHATTLELDENVADAPVKKPKLLCKIDVGDWVVRDACQCLNESTTHRFPALFRPFVDTTAEKSETIERKATDSEAEPSKSEEDDYLESNVDEQLLLLVKFTPRLKLHEIHLQVFDDGSAPKNVRLFVNEPHLSFEDAGDAIPAQTVTLTEEDLVKEGNNVLKIPLKLIKFQKVDTVSVFVEDNMGGKERTRIRRIRFIGDAYQKVMIDLTNDK
ncbi:Thioredoxin family protein 1, putative [Acanthamoeba castellanii str. Neff]|uniref:Thioredoxin family protein 1, putative n=1 Tax=Acanthamoeba castellanii (strain ATCC 30010 / Neff) TaxID=1257118 RepID=L8H1G6_ACACF|nr:Thioredoxin family protein 1, putative [Acanthamoeba castellanii str. Neff]ELR19354.1 Thioredoxin family protein 1, putative [Acanthamoeba castellanii str. Neff]